MGLMRFLVAPRNRIAPEQVDCAYLIGPELIPWNTRAALHDGVLSVSRNESDSACLCLPYPVPGRGLVMLTTGTLVERFAPYHLGVELARGKINQVRNQMADWQALGLAPKEEQESELREALSHLARAVTTQHDAEQAAAHADLALAAALDVADGLASRYADKILLARKRHDEHLPTWLAGNLGHRLLSPELSRQVVLTFNAATVPLVWRDVESQEGQYRWDVYDRQVAWCFENNLKIIAGPLLRFDDRGLPDWLALWQGDFDNLLAFVSDYVETVVHRYQGKVNVWECAARVNVDNALSMSEEERLRLAVRALEIVRKADPQTPVIVRFDQPWAESMGRADADLPPLQFADLLVRSGLDLSGLGLELNVCYHPGGTSPFDRMEYSRMLDRWAVLGLPLWLYVTVPGGSGPDAKAWSRAQPIAGYYAEGWTPETQRQWLRDFAPLLVAKPAVAGVVYNQLCDGFSHELLHGGLFDPAGAAKPALATLAKFRKLHLA